MIRKQARNWFAVLALTVIVGCVGLSRGAFPAISVVRGAEGAGELLYNGIRLPATWPPRLDKLTREPMQPPYLAAPPAVIPIDVGRQLFVDDFLIEQTTMKRTFHLAKYVDDNPVLKPDGSWELRGEPTAMVFSDGVWYDPQDKLFKLWYMGGLTAATCYATSRDGMHWDKPQLDVKPGTNIVHDGYRDSTTVWLDLEEKNPARRYKLWRSVRAGQGWALDIHFSPDGIHWSSEGKSGPCGDRTTVFYNPFRQKWVYSIRGGFSGMGRVRQYHEHDDALAGAKWKEGEPVWWIGADRLDPIRDDLKTPCQLYNLDAVAYESLMIGLFSIWRGQPADRAKPNEVYVGFSRDGFHWDRPDHRAFIPVSERHGDWNWCNVQSAGGCCLVVGDKLYFYVSGRAGVPGSPRNGVSTTALAVLRRDGFASMDAVDTEATLTTRPIRFGGKHLFVNARCLGGELRVEALDEGGKVIAPFTTANCAPVRADSTIAAVQWKGSSDLGALAKKTIRFRFHLKNGSLYAFWVSPNLRGASHGYVAAGGPGFSESTDTLGRYAR